MCPPVALDAGVGLLCRLFELWGQVPAGVLALTEWLLGEEEANDEAVADEASSLVRIHNLRVQEFVSVTSEQNIIYYYYYYFVCVCV